MDYEDFVNCAYTSINAILILSDVIYEKINEDWEFFQNDKTNANVYELLALIYSINLHSKYLLNLKKKINV